MAERDLGRLLTQIGVEKREHAWQFQTVPKEASSWVDLVSLRGIQEIAMIFIEREGPTMIVRADETVPEDARWSWLEITVNSDLHAVGFLSAISAALSEVGIPCNAVAGYHHDHIFVPESHAADAEQAILALKAPT